MCGAPPQDLDLTGKRVVVIGSGSTAATLIPAIAEQAAHGAVPAAGVAAVLAEVADPVVRRMVLQAVLRVVVGRPLN